MRQVTGLDEPGDRAGQSRCPGWMRHVPGLDRQVTGLDEPGALQFIKTLDFNEDGYIDKHEFMDMWSLMFE